MSVEHIITQYSTRGDAAVVAANNKIASSARNAHAATQGNSIGNVTAPPIMGGGGSGGLGSGIANGIGGAISGLATGTAAFLGAEAAFAQKSFSNFQEYDLMVRQLTGALGSIEAGGQAMEFLKKEAAQTSFHLQELTAAGVMLASGGLGLKETLPLAEKFAAALGGTPQDLEQVAGALLRIKGGAFGEAFEVFRRVGIGANELRSQGVKISKGGEVTSTAQEVMHALANLSGPDSPIGRMAEEVAKSAATKVSNAGDAAWIAMVEFGKAVSGSALPLIEQFTSGLQKITADGSVKVVADSFTDLMTAFAGGVNVADTVDNFARGVYVANAYLKDFAETLKDLKPNKDGESGGYKKWMDFLPWPHIRNAILGKGEEYVKAKVGEFEAAKPSSEFARMAEERARDAAKGKQVKIGDGLDGGNGGVSAAIKTLLQTEESKANAARAGITRGNVLSRSITGGGDIGRLGVTSVELGHGAATRTPIVIHGGDELNKGVKRIVIDLMDQLYKRGQLGSA